LRTIYLNKWDIIKLKMTLIYKIVDNTNGNIYVGSTSQKMHRRMVTHKSKNNGCSSEKIIKNNDYEVIIIEECSEKNRNVREQYWKDNLKCVNIKNMVYDEKKYKREYCKKHKEEKKEYDRIRRKWKISFGETKRDVCNLTNIDVNLFS